jgi:hypothetical protein
MTDATSAAVQAASSFVGSGLEMTSQAVKNTVKAATSIVANPTTSLVEFFKQVSVELDVEAYGKLLPAITLTMLFLHFLLYNLENIENIAPTWKQTFNELRIYIQVTIVSNLLYYGAVILGLMQANSAKPNNYTFVQYVGFFTLLCLLVNKFMVLLTGDNNPEYIKVGVEPSPIVDPTGNKVNRYFYVICSWIQTVTDIIVQKLVPGAFFGYTVGKVVMGFRGERVTVF